MPIRILNGALFGKETELLNALTSMVHFLWSTHWKGGANLTNVSLIKVHAGKGERTH